MSPTVLVVDDSRTIRKVVEMALKASPFEVLGASNAREGMQAAQRLPAVILLDYYMPDASGYEVCRALKGNPSTAHIPIVMLGGNARQFSEVDARQAGADDVVMKPFLTDTLVSAIERLADGQVTSAAPTPAPAFQPPKPVAPAVAPPARPAPPPFATKPQPPTPQRQRVETPTPEPQRVEPSGPQRIEQPAAASAPAQPRTPATSTPGRLGGSQPRIATPDVNASTRAQDVAASAPVAPSTTSDSGVSNIGMSRAEIETVVKEEVQNAVKEQLPGLLRTVMGEVFQKKVLPKLVEHGEQRVNSIVENSLNEKIADVVRLEIERLLAED
ncbi:response regulator [Bradymonas sediminis]|uniref:Uncharacterized protein n=1 Tax=Bradymonas sediminis TaxID=1548548 RepID=A0A2Z4FQ40_9DELT|nr:response regulator [Bradymonas sediminis]AWV91109.1 hypothetical protein DN745_17935 [Bradymonas sediminis]TDP75148.1 response regulator receiver domain-containing protein [Bradymonas sediminis]